jgi:hypothetical protein
MKEKDDLIKNGQMRLEAADGGVAQQVFRSASAATLIYRVCFWY